MNVDLDHLTLLRLVGCLCVLIPLVCFLMFTSISLTLKLLEKLGIDL